MLAPLIRGGNRHAALIMLEGLALVVLWFLAVHFSRTLPVPAGAAARCTRPDWGLVVLGTSPVWIGLLQLLPLPPGWSLALPGRSDNLQALAALQVSGDAWRPLSLVPDATRDATLAGLPVASAFLLGLVMSDRQARWWMRLAVFAALVQAVIGLLQVSLYRELYFGVYKGHGRVVGTFANPNHLACWLAMCLPFAVVMLRASLQRTGRRSGDPVRDPSWLARAAHYLALFGPTFWMVVVLLLASTLLATVSRGGILAALLTAVPAAVFLPLRHRSGGIPWRTVSLTLGLLCLVVVLVGWNGLATRMGEGELARSLVGTRWTLIVTSLQAGLSLLPFGAGIGTFALVYPRFQPLDMGGFVPHVHHDYVQFFLESGLLALGVALAIGWRLWQRAVQVARQVRQHPLDLEMALRAAAGLGLLAILLQAMTEFPMRIPANAFLAAALAGLFLRPLPGPAAVEPRSTSSR